MLRLSLPHRLAARTLLAFGLTCFGAGWLGWHIAAGGPSSASLATTFLALALALTNLASVSSVVSKLFSHLLVVSESTLAFGREEFSQLLSIPQGANVSQGATPEPTGRNISEELARSSSRLSGRGTQGTEAREKTRSAAGTESTDGPTRALLVTDDSQQRTSVVPHLHRMGLDVASVPSIARAQELWLAQAYDIAILDRPQLEGDDALPFLELIGKSPATASFAIGCPSEERLPPSCRSRGLTCLTGDFDVSDVLAALAATRN